MNMIVSESEGQAERNHKREGVVSYKVSDTPNIDPVMQFDYLVTEDPKQAVKQIGQYKSGQTLVVHFSNGPKLDELREHVSLVVQLFQSMADVLKKRADKSVIEAMVDMALPKPAPEPHVLKEAAMTIRARERVLNSGDLLTAADIAKLAGFSEKNPSTQPNKWKKAGLIFAVQHKGTDYFPSYSFDPQNGFRPHKAMAKIIEIFGDRKGDWGKAYWFSSDNSFLSGSRPQDVLAKHPERVIAAAKDELEGVAHG